MLSNNPSVDSSAIYGYEHPDWLIGSMDPNKKCEDVKGQPVGVDSHGGARSIALDQLLRSCGLAAEDTQQVAMSSNVGTAMISGQLQVRRAAHRRRADHRARIRQEGQCHHRHQRRRADQPLHDDGRRRARRPTRIAKRYVRVLAAHDRSDQASSATPRTPTRSPRRRRRPAAASMMPRRRPRCTSRWISGRSKVTACRKKNIDDVIETQKRVGGIRPDATPVAYDRFSNSVGL